MSSKINFILNLPLKSSDIPTTVSAVGLLELQEKILPWAQWNAGTRPSKCFNT
jgi:hypothetical protein